MQISVGSTDFYSLCFIFLYQDDTDCMAWCVRACVHMYSSPPAAVRSAARTEVRLRVLDRLLLLRDDAGHEEDKRPADPRQHQRGERRRDAWCRIQICQRRGENRISKTERSERREMRSTSISRSSRWRATTNASPSAHFPDSESLPLLLSGQLEVPFTRPLSQCCGGP